MAVELLTVVSHPGNPSQRTAPDRYSAEMVVRHRVDIVEGQFLQLELKRGFFGANNLLVSVNVDGPTLIVMHQDPEVLEITKDLLQLRFELVEYIHLPRESSLASMYGFSPFWLDNLGTGMANSSVFSEVSYDYIEVAQDLSVMLRKTPEGRDLFTLLLQFMNCYCRDVIVEGVETLEGWHSVQNSPASATQNYLLPRPVPLNTFEEVILSL